MDKLRKLLCKVGIIENSKTEFDKYLNDKINNEDKILFQEAIIAANNKLYRGAYILSWLSCLESLKRKFKECSKAGDQEANDKYAEIIDKEKNHQSTDEMIIDKAKKYGFLEDYEFAILEEIWKFRCIYAHPYEKAPSEENVKSAMSDIVEIVLSKPTMLSKSYIDNLIKKLTEDIDYLNDYENTVRQEAKNWLNKINKENRCYFFETYLNKAQAGFNSVQSRVFTNRAKWVLEEIILELEYKTYSEEKWLQMVENCPNMCVVLAEKNEEFFLNIGERAQDYLISKILNFAVNKPVYLNILVPFLEKKEILRDNYNKIISMIESLPVDAFKLSGLELKYYINTVFNALESGDFYRQNPAVILVQENEQSIATLESDEKFKLGKLIHRAAYFNAWDAEHYRNRIVSNPNEFQLEFLKGFCSIITEVSSSNEHILFRDDILGVIDSLITNLNNNNKDIIDYVNTLINRYVDYELNEGNYTLEEIIEHWQFDRYQWINLQTSP